MVEDRPLKVRWTDAESRTFRARLLALRAERPTATTREIAIAAQADFPAHRQLRRPWNNLPPGSLPRQPGTGAKRLKYEVGRVRSPNQLVHPRMLLMSLGVPRHLIRSRRTKRYLGAWWDANAERLHDLHRLAQRTYREKIKTLHPDHCGDAEQAASLTNIWRRWQKLFKKECRKRGWNE